MVQSYQKGVELRKAEAEREALNAGRGGHERRLSNSSSDMTTLADHQARSRPESIIFKDFDAHSISSCNSIDSLGQRAPAEPKNEIYEEWLLRWNPPVENVQSSWGFFGLKIKGYYENSGFWELHPELRTEAEMKEQHDISCDNLPPSKHREAMQKAIQAIPKEGGSHIDRLLEERTEASSMDAKREWSIVAVRSKQKFPYGSNKKWGKDPKYSDWLITIKGETVDTFQRDRHSRWEDPFQQRDGRYRSPIRIRSRSPARRRVHPRRRLPRYSGPLRPQPTSQRPFFLRQSSVGLPTPIDAKGDFRSGSLVVGKLMSVEGAEEKMKDIWAEITAEKAPVTEVDNSSEFLESYD